MHAFEIPQKSIDWALTCAQKGHEAAISYLQNDAFARIVEDNPDATERIDKIILKSPPPIEVEGPFRNAIVDLKHSFDQSLFAVAHTLGCARLPKNYPWADSPDGLEGILNKRQGNPKTKLKQIIIDEIWSQQPYATGPTFVGGNDFIREIANMANDKHTIGFTAVPQADGFTATNVRLGGNVKLGLGWDPVKKEFVISSVQHGSSASYNLTDISANIFLDRTGSIGKVPVHELIREFAKKAQIVLDGFKALCT